MWIRCNASRVLASATCDDDAISIAAHGFFLVVGGLNPSEK